MNGARVDGLAGRAPDWLQEAALCASRAAAQASARGDHEIVLALWEWRISLEATPKELISEIEDGGCRLERLDRRSDKVTGARFIVGGEPEDLGLIGGAVSTGRSGPAAAPVRERARELAWSDLQAVQHGARRIPAGSLPASGQLRLRVWCRARAAGLDDGRSFVSVDTGVRLRSEVPGEPPRVLWIGSPSQAPTWPEGVDWAARARDRIEAPCGGRPLAPGHRGRVRLSAEAAAWWVHEMGHAALEAPAERAVRGPDGVVIVDDPRAAPWPAGFQRDDLGYAAGADTLWDRAGCHLPSARGRWRRPSVRHRAGPALASTSLRLERGAGLGPEESELDLPVIDRIDAARFDPRTRLIYLRIRQTGGVGVDGVAVVPADESWQGLHIHGGDAAVTPDLAACSRQGGLNPVMVGAPTLSLEVHHVAWACAPPTAGNGAKMAVTSGVPAGGGQGMESVPNPLKPGGPASSDDMEFGTKVSHLVEAHADRDGVAVIRGVEQGSWSPSPRAGPDRPRTGPETSGIEQQPSRHASDLRADLMARIAGLSSGPLEVALSRARIVETSGCDREGRQTSAQEITTATVTASSPAGLGWWSRVTLWNDPDRGWPPGFPEAIGRAVDLPEAFEIVQEECGRNASGRLPAVLDVFALADLLRGAAQPWLVGSIPMRAPVAADSVQIWDHDQDGSQRSVVESGRLCWDLGRAPRRRSSWRAPPHRGWELLELRLTPPAACEWPREALVITRVDRIGRTLFVSGLVWRDGAPAARWGPLAAPEPGWWLMRLEHACGPHVVDGTGPPVSVPPCRVRGFPSEPGAGHSSS